MAAYIDRIQFSPASSNLNLDQYVEIRGSAGANLPSGTYLVAVNSVDSSVELGDVQAIFNLSGQALGANGNLAIVQANNGYEFEAGTAMIAGDNGFQGAAGFSADNGVNILRAGSMSFLLIESSRPPQLSDDIDTNDDGVPDGVYAGWTILDGASVLAWSESASTQKSYAPIVFTERNVGSFLTGSTVVSTDFVGMITRINQSTGFGASDWKAGNSPDIVQDSLSVAENSLGGVEIGTISTIERDSTDSLSFEMISQTSPWVSIHATTGVVSVLANASIDFEGANQNSVTVRVTDSSGLSATRQITILATNTNDPPVLSTPVQNQRAVVGKLFMLEIPSNTFTDQDADESLVLNVTRANGSALPSWLTFDRSTRTLGGTPALADGGNLIVQLTATDRGNALTGTEFSIFVDTNPFPWNNTARPNDVNNDGLITALDALLVINQINASGTTQVPPGSEPTLGYLDTSRDNVVSAIDALLVINEINQRIAGEAEALPLVADGNLTIELQFPWLAYDVAQANCFAHSRAALASRL